MHGNLYTLLLRFFRTFTSVDDLQADAYSGYWALYRGGRVVEVGCWAHCRRKFFEIAKVQKTPGLASAALAWIARLYAIERTIRDLTPDQKLRQRQEHSVPLLAEFRCWLDGHVPQLVPQAPLAQAFSYALRNWDALVRYTENGVLVPDNNAIEQAIRPIAVGRSNYLFAGSARGGHAAATMYSLVVEESNCVTGFNACFPLDRGRKVTHLPARPRKQLCQLVASERKSVNSQL